MTVNEMPVAFSQMEYEPVQVASRAVELFRNPHDDSNLSEYLARVLKPTVAFFDKYVKGHHP